MNGIVRDKDVNISRVFFHKSDGKVDNLQNDICDFLFWDDDNLEEFWNRI